MEWILDVVLIAIAVITVIIYTIKGFVKAFLGTFKYLIALLIGYLAASPVGAWISNIYFKDVVNGRIYSIAIAFLAVFLLSVILLSVLIFFLDKLFDSTPGLRQINKGLGFLFGLICAFVNLIVVCSTITLVLNITSMNNPDFSFEALKEQTVIYKWISNIDVFSWFL